MTNSNQPIRLFFVDDHDIVREGLIRLVEDNPSFQIVGQAANGVEAINIIDELELKPNVVMTDIEMPAMDGIALTKALQDKYGSSVKVVALSMIKNKMYIKKMLQAGARGYMLKNCHSSQLEKAILEVSENNTYFCTEVSNLIMDELVGSNKPNLSINDISSREMEVLQLIVQDYSNQEIADKLHISIRTVETHKQNLILKTGVKSVAGLVVYAIKNQITDFNQ